MYIFTDLPKNCEMQTDQSNKIIICIKSHFELINGKYTDCISRASPLFTELFERRHHTWRNKKNIELWNSIPPKASAFDDLTQSSISCALTQNTLRCKCSGIQRFGLFNRYGHSYIHMDNTCVHSIRKINDRHYCQSTYYVTSKFLRDSYGASF